ncbi:AChain A, fructan 1-exohydrolase Iia [Tanacetum coccineum]
MSRDIIVLLNDNELLEYMSVHDNDASESSKPSWGNVSLQRLIFLTEAWTFLVMCPNCGNAVESRNHLFFGCSMAFDLFRLLSQWWNIDIINLIDPFSWESWFNGLRLNNLQKLALEASTNGLDTSAYSGSSVMHVMKAGFEGHDWYTIGTYSPDLENFLPQNGLSSTGNSLNLRYDYGQFYASKSFFDDAKNRRVLWAWVPESDSQEDDIAKGWAGLQSFPRTLWIDRSGKQLIQWPVQEIELLRENEVTLQNKNLKPGSVLEIEGITASQADVTISFKLEDLKEAEVLDTTSVDPQALCTERGASSKGAFGPFGLLAMASKDLEEQTAIFFRVFQNQNGRYSVLMCSDLSRSTVRSNIDTTSFGAFVDIDPQYNELSLRNLRLASSFLTTSFGAFVDTDPQYNEISLGNLIDHSIIESFGAEEKTCITSRIYPKFVNNEDAHLYAFNNGTQSVKISQMSAWSMKNADSFVKVILWPMNRSKRSPAEGRTGKVAFGSNSAPIRLNYAESAMRTPSLPEDMRNNSFLLPEIFTFITAYYVCDDPDYFYDYVQGLLDGLEAGVQSRDIVKIENAKGVGYAMSTSEELKFVKEVAESTGLILDPVYRERSSMEDPVGSVVAWCFVGEGWRE